MSLSSHRIHDTTNPLSPHRPESSLHSPLNDDRLPFFYDLTTVTTLSPSPPNFYNCPHVANISEVDPVSNIRSLIHSSHWVNVARGLRGKEAERLIEFIDQVITFPGLHERLRKQCLYLLYKICKACEMLPTSYVLQQELINVGKIRRCGGFADVSEGEYLGRHVAIKHLRFGMEDAFNDIFKRLCREIICWKRLSHPNILPLLGVSVSTDPQSFRIVSDWMRNGNVMEYIRSNPEENRLHLLSGIMSGATYLHELGVIHGDLKGANILVDDNGTARLGDFGLMTVLIDLNTIPLSATAMSTTGTVRWMSPELLFCPNSPPTRESDCYALGMVIYEVLTGLPPFHRLGFYEVVIAVREGKHPMKPDNPETLGFSDTLWGLMEMCWSESPSSRPTAQELLRYLQDASHAWAPWSTLQYPVPDDHDWGTGLGFTSSDERNRVLGAVASGLCVLIVSVLCVLLLPSF